MTTKADLRYANRVDQWMVDVYEDLSVDLVDCTPGANRRRWSARWFPRVAELRLLGSGQLELGAPTREQLGIVELALAAGCYVRDGEA